MKTDLSVTIINDINIVYTYKRIQLCPIYNKIHYPRSDLLKNDCHPSRLPPTIIGSCITTYSNEKWSVPPLIIWFITIVYPRLTHRLLYYYIHWTRQIRTIKITKIRLYSLNKPTKKTCCPNFLVRLSETPWKSVFLNKSYKLYERSSNTRHKWLRHMKWVFNFTKIKIIIRL